MVEQDEFCLTRAPTRIDLGGGWTDVPPYSEREGGFVCNVAITRYATARVARVARGAGNSTEPIVQAALNRAGVPGLGAAIHSDFPIGAGLGGSSAATAALLGALAAWKGEALDRVGIAELGRQIEVDELGVPGGRQDHYAATHGGALALTFGRTTGVERIPMDDALRREFVERSVLLYTGQARISGDTITAVLGAYEAKDAAVLASLRRMRELAQLMAGALRARNLDDVGRLVREHWEHQRALHPAIPTARIDEIVRRALDAGALGAKAMGASGGGTVLVFCSSGDRDRVREAIGDLGEDVEFDLDQTGLAVLETSLT